mmetsp:Transcript_2660/g.6768  ORF Transcript_2660/g.6768 Transcript_2660/m.6768 type:complete len:256 (-) Transcript_2660:669-1436(-)
MSCRCVASIREPTFANMLRCTSDTLAPSCGPPLTKASCRSVASSPLPRGPFLCPLMNATTALSLLRISPHVALASPPPAAPASPSQRLARNAMMSSFSFSRRSSPCSRRSWPTLLTYSGSLHCPPIEKSVAAARRASMSGMLRKLRTPFPPTTGPHSKGPALKSIMAQRPFPTQRSTRQSGCACPSWAALRMYSLSSLRLLCSRRVAMTSNSTSLGSSSPSLPLPPTRCLSSRSYLSSAPSPSSLSSSSEGCLRQ